MALSRSSSFSLLTIPRLLLKLYYGFYFFLTLSLLYPLFAFLLASKGRYKYAFLVKRFWSFLLQIGYLSPLKTTYEAELPKGAFVICSNHSSYLDIIFMYRVIPHYFLFMGKQELSNWPLFRIFFRTMDIAVDRKNAAGAAKAFKRAKEALSRGEAVAIFPEGTIPKTVPKLSRFKDGAFKLAVETGAPIVPVTFLTNWKLLGNVEKLNGSIRPGLVEVVVHKPISTEGLTEKDLVALRTQVFETIDSTINERWK